MVMPRAAFHAAILGAYAALALVLTYPVALHPRSTIPIAHQIPGWRPGDGDPWQALWALWLTANALVTTGRVPLSTTLIFYPLGVDIWYASSIVPAVLTVLPLIGLAGLVTAYNVMIIGSLALAGYATFLLVRRVTGQTGPAFIGGLVFAFSPYHMAHALEHVFLLASGVLLPLYVLVLIRAFEDGSRFTIVLAALLLALATVANIYYAVFLALFTVLLLAARLRERGARRRLWWRFAGLLLAGAVFTGPYVAFVVPRVAMDTEPRPALADVNQWNADLLAFFTPSPGHPWWGRPLAPVYANFSGNIFEQTVYLGYVTLILAGVALVWRREARFWALAGVVFAVLALGPLLHVAGRWAFDVGGMSVTVPLPAILLYFVPGVSALRVLSRFAAMVMLTMAVLTGLGTAALRDRLTSVHPRPLLVRAVSIVFGLAIVVDYLSVPLPVLSTHVPRVLQAMGAEPAARGSLLDVPLDWRVAKYEYYQTAHGKPLLVGLVPRPAPAVQRQVEGVPFLSLFQDPGRHEHAGSEHWDRRAALRVIDLFDLDTIVIHGEYLDPATAGRVQTIVMKYFPVASVLEEDGLTIMRLRRDHDPVAAWTPDAYDFDFAPGRPRFFVAKGWWPPEQSGPVGMAWSMGRESTLGVYVPRAAAMTMDLELSPFPALPTRSQRVTVTVNERAIGRIELNREAGWRAHTLRVPAAVTRAGINVIRFAYDYAATPRDLIPGSRDAREVAVAFRRVRLRQQ